VKIINATETQTPGANAFTLIELLVVISILGLLAALSVPVIKNFGKSDATLGASRQLLDNVARARQLAISQRTTVYMVFIATTFFTDASGQFLEPWFANLTPAQLTVLTDLADRQLSGYTFVAYGAMGNQPGYHQWHYLAPWQSLPDGTFIAYQKFVTNETIVDQVSGATFSVQPFAYTNIFPFPTDMSASGPMLPYIAFNYLGQLTFDGQTMADRDEYIPLARGSVLVQRNPQTKVPVLSVPNLPDVLENPPGNSTDSAYNIVHIDRLTGRAVLEYERSQ
jgi:prepilin-type N-terminal cleavage/methylation domain-containing protein